MDRVSLSRSNTIEEVDFKVSPLANPMANKGPQKGINSNLMQV